MIAEHRPSPDHAEPRPVRWEKRGLIFVPAGDVPWMRSHASLPVPIHVEGDTYRILFAARDHMNRSSIGALTIELAPSVRVIGVDRDPVLPFGPLGHFDDHGVYPSSVVRTDEGWRLYYIGWNPGARGSLFYSSIGLAVGDASGRAFQRVSAAPILARSEWDPCLVTSPCVRRDEGTWRMWYVSGFRWTEDAEGMHSYYHIKYAESADGIEWRREGRVAVDLAGAERNVARPTVAADGDRYRMWYSYDAGGGYRLGYAESPDGLDWTRHDHLAGLTPSVDGWDSEAQAYPCVFMHGGLRHMLYNGNGFGRTGFGLAVEVPA